MVIGQNQSSRTVVLMPRAPRRGRRVRERAQRVGGECQGRRSGDQEIPDLPACVQRLAEPPGTGPLAVPVFAADSGLGT
jgi:hypothetical protein